MKFGTLWYDRACLVFEIVPIYSHSEQDPEAVLRLASKVRGDRKLLKKLSDRVYQLMLEDLRYQKERHRN